MSRFLNKYRFGQELEAAPPMVLREATGPGNKSFIVKIFCKGTIQPQFLFFRIQYLQWVSPKKTFRLY